MVVFNSIRGQGVIYSVIVRDPLLNTSASYVPVHTYACSFDSTVDSCQTLGKSSCLPQTVQYVFAVLTFIVEDLNCLVMQQLQPASNEYTSSVSHEIHNVNTEHWQHSWDTRVHRWPPIHQLGHYSPPPDHLRL